MEVYQLRQMQSLPLELKIIKTQQRIREWYEHWDGQVYVSVSGKDSTALLDLVRDIYPNVPAVFCNTGLEWPEIVEHVKTMDNVHIIKPEMPFRKVIDHYGYPVISKEQSSFIYEYRTTQSGKLRHYRWHGNDKGGFKIADKWKFLVDAPFKISDKCCDVMKKNPFKEYEKETKRKPFLGISADEGVQRQGQWLRHGCNAFSLGRPRSTPLGFWMEEDIWEYLNTFNVPYSPIYDMGYTRTGCMFCLFGIHLEQRPNRFERMKKTHPKQWNYCINKLGCGEVLDYIGVEYGKNEQLSLEEAMTNDNQS